MSEVPVSQCIVLSREQVTAMVLRINELEKEVKTLKNDSPFSRRVYIKALESKVARMREALEPFAKLADEIPNSLAICKIGESAYTVQVLCEWLLNARAVLQPQAFSDERGEK